MSTHNPYQAPTAELRRKMTSSIPMGSLEDGTTGNYDFTIMEVIKEAWQKTEGVKGAVWGAVLVVGLITALIGAGFGFVMAMLDFRQEDIVFAILSQLVSVAVLYPFLAGIMMIAIHRSVDLPVSFSMAFGYFGFIAPVVIAAILITILTFLGILLLIIPGIYLSVAYLLTVPLIVEKNLGAWDAMEASRKAITHRWFGIFGTYLLMGLIVGITSILIIPLIWTLPMMININGILYRIIFGVEAVR